MKKNSILIITFFLSILTLVFNSASAAIPTLIMRIIDLLILAIITVEIIRGLRTADYKRQFFLRNIPLIIFASVYLIILGYMITADFISTPGDGSRYFSLVAKVLRSLFLLYRMFEEVKSLEQALHRLNDRPALSIISSFMAIITIGTLLLMLPPATADGRGLRFLDAWFTATSAVCVTGLIVVDTAAVFSLTGKIIILALIQTGGLGIMIMTYFSMFILRRKATLAEKQRLSFVISDTDISGITTTLKKIIYLTFSIEAAGALLLFTGFGRESGFSGRTIFNAVFHSISAFCNAGFSLFSDSLEGFVSRPLIIFTVSALIILGGLSFAVIFNLAAFFNPSSKVRKLNINTRIVLSWTAVLLLLGFFFFYASEHGGSLRSYSTPTQYIAAFFQSVTLRTAGFNSIGFSGFSTGTILIMCFFMFIGAASGSTAGGIKINTTAVIAAYLKCIALNSPRVTLYRHQLSERRVLRAFAVFFYGVTAVLAGSTALALTHNAPLRDILFEAVSAFGTVGLSTGMTAKLNSFGKVVIIFLMFNGRLGPLTILSTFSGRSESGVRYPQGDILIG
ncbi:MAG: potassium transporter TrkG [Spirochaetales bacterium]|uniref:Potassium transporter TrkG n=1 Tax=Candidatus Thalassospirochaeta sargassi TaxID=3119039 RepID=A0AAJ1IDK6_9SPIO|nr:potassium transporter TrkG [Spirochaetales bacterium]